MNMLCCEQMEEGSQEEASPVDESRASATYVLDHHSTGNPFAAGKVSDAAAEDTYLPHSSPASKAAKLAKTVGGEPEAMPGEHSAQSKSLLKSRASQHHCMINSRHDCHVGKAQSRVLKPAAPLLISF